MDSHHITTCDSQDSRNWKGEQGEKWGVQFIKNDLIDCNGKRQLTVDWWILGRGPDILPSEKIASHFNIATSGKKKLKR